MLSSDELQGYLDNTDTTFIKAMMPQVMSAYAMNFENSRFSHPENVPFNFGGFNGYSPCRSLDIIDINRSPGSKCEVRGYGRLSPPDLLFSTDDSIRMGLPSGPFPSVIIRIKPSFEHCQYVVGKSRQINTFCSQFAVNFSGTRNELKTFELIESQGGSI